MNLFTDNPIDSVEEDKLGFATYAEILRDTILGTESLPFCIGIFGAWGSGKTSLMKMVDKLIAKEHTVRSIWFSPWKYDTKEDLWSALIQTILYRITEELSRKRQKKEAVRLAKALGLAATWLALKKATVALSQGVVTEQNLDSLVRGFGNQDELHYRHINRFEEDFKKVINEYTENGKLVIFVDDLDRCLPENAITVLEALKLFFGDAKCVFVLGMDRYVVEEGIKRRFGERINVSGRDYLDKIIQVPFFLPPAPFERLKASMLSEVEEDRFKLDIQSDTLWELIRLGMGGNPRNTKRFVNCFYLLQHILNRGEIGYSPNDAVAWNLTREDQNFYLAKLLIFQMSFSDFYLHLQLFPNAWQHIENNKDTLLSDNIDKRKEDSKSYELEPFLQNSYFRTFMRRTSRGHEPPSDFPPPPPRETVVRLSQAVSIVTEEPLG